MQTILEFLDSQAAIILGPLIVLMLGLIIEYWVIQPLSPKRRITTSKKESYGAKLSRLVDNLNKTSNEVDAILEEISRTAQERESTIRRLESEISKLEMSEKEYKERIESLRNVPLSAIDHLVKQLEPVEKKSARREYLLFFAGVVASAIVSIILSLLGIGN